MFYHLRLKVYSLHFDTSNLQSIILAYEPVWAIGTGKVARNEDIEETVSNIKEFVSTHYHVDLPVLYGGSVNPSNIASLEVVPNIDGYLIGGASLDPKKDRRNVKGGTLNVALVCIRLRFDENDSRSWRRLTQLHHR